MAGGTFVTQNKKRPGVYTRIIGNSSSSRLAGTRGVVAMGTGLSWGPTQDFIKITSDDLYNGNMESITGYPTSDPKNKQIRAVLENAHTLLLYRLNNDVGGLTSHVPTGSLGADWGAKARYPGLAGNLISVEIVENEDGFNVNTYFRNTLKNQQFVKNGEKLVDNDLVVWEYDDDSTLTYHPTVPVLFVDGNDGDVTTADYGLFLSKLSSKEFNVLAAVNNEEVSIFTGDDIKEFIVNMRETIGVQVQAVINNYIVANHEGIISTNNQGIEYADSTLNLQPEDFVAYLAGAEAGADYVTALTYKVIPNATGIINPSVETDVENLLGQGYLLLTVNRNGDVVIERDINTLTTYTTEKNEQFSFNKTIRLLDELINAIAKDFELNYIGKVNNDVNGQNLFKAAIVSRMTDLQTNGAIQNFNSATDVIVTAGEQPDSMYAIIYVQPTYSVEKLYLEVNVG